MEVHLPKCLSYERKYINLGRFTSTEVGLVSAEVVFIFAKLLKMLWTDFDEMFKKYSQWHKGQIT